MKVKCTGYKQKEKHFTIGKIYEVSTNGEIRCDTGYIYGSEETPEKMIEWLSRWYSFEVVPDVDRCELHITCNDGKTTNAVYKVNGKIVERKQALLSPKDTFDFAIGAQTAFDRVFPKAIPSQPIAPQEDKPRYKSGDKVKVVGDTCCHGARMGDILTLTDNKTGAIASRLPAWHYVENTGYISECDFEPYAEPEQPKLTVTRDMLVKLNACNGGLLAFYRLFPSGNADFEEAVLKASKDYECRVNDYHGWLASKKSKIEAMQNEQPKEPIKLYCVKDYLLPNGLSKGELYEFNSGIGMKYNKCLGAPYATYEEYKQKESRANDCLIKAEKRPAKVGEWVVCVNGSFGYAGEDKTSPVKVISRDSNSVRAVFPLHKSGNAGIVFDTEYLVLDNYHPEPEKEPEPVYLNMKVVCTKSTKCYHTVGMGYEIKDGFINYDGGSGAYNRKPITTLEEFNERQPDKFIPYLGEA